LLTSRLRKTLERLGRRRGDGRRTAAHLPEHF
jgi:hypothetical protein